MKKDYFKIEKEYLRKREVEKETKKRQKKKDVKYWCYDLENTKFIPRDKNGNVITTERKATVVYLSNLLEVDFSLSPSENKTPIVNSYFFRLFEDFISYLDSINNNGYYNIIYCHNLNYENSYLRNVLRSLDMVKTIFRGTSSVLQAFYFEYPNIEFRCSYALLNMSVAELGKKLGNPFNKLVDNIDYNEIILPTDKLEGEKKRKLYDYVEQDNKIVAMSIWKNINDGIYNSDKLPLTFTGNVRETERLYIKEHCVKNRRDYNGKLKKTRPVNSLTQDKRNLLFNSDLLTNDEKERMMNLEIKNYRGGLTGANHKYVSQLLDEVYSIDKKSDYPFQMVFRSFPHYKKGSCEIYEDEIANEFINDFLNILNDESFIDSLNQMNIKGFRGEFILHNVTIKHEDVLSVITDIKGKTTIKGDKENIKYNGKYHKIKSLEVVLNEVDFECYLNLYNIGKIECKYLLTTNSTRLLKYRPQFILKCFNDKENVADKESKDYILSKQCINGLYGVLVQKPTPSDFYINDEGLISELTYLESTFCDNPNLSKVIFNEYVEGFEEICQRNFNIYSDGVYVCSYARKELVEMQLFIKKHGGLMIYSDTDSCKFIIPKEEDKKRIVEGIKKLNEEIINNNRKHKPFVNYVEENRPKYNKKLSHEENEIIFNKYDLECEKIYKLGIWEFETWDKENDCLKPIRNFKTLGAKKYIYEDYNPKSGRNEIFTTIAGCSKNLGKYFTDYAINNEIPFYSVIDNFFTDGIIYTSNISGRTFSLVNSPTFELYQNDIYCYSEIENKLVKVETKGGIYIENTTYKLSLSKEDRETYEKYDGELWYTYAMENLEPLIFDGFNFYPQYHEEYAERLKAIEDNTYSEKYLGKKILIDKRHENFGLEYIEELGLNISLNE